MYLIDRNGYNLITQVNSVKYAVGENQWYEFDFNTSVEISKEDYSRAKYGEINKNYDIINYSYSKFPNGNFVTVAYTKDNIVRLHSPDGKVLELLETINSNWGQGINDIATDNKGNIWVVDALEHFAGQFDIKGNLLFKIEGKQNLNPGKLNYPEAITSVDKSMYISDMGNRRIVEIDINTYELKAYLNVPEPVYQFERMGNFEFYQLSSGLYYSDIGKEVKSVKRYLP